MDEAAKACRGKIIRSIRIEQNELVIKFEDRTLILADIAEYCCERRYMSTDDPLHYWEGLVFVGYRIMPSSRTGHRDDESCHDEQFLIVDTFLGSFTVVNHNVHNGYYGGFDISEHLITNPQQEQDDDGLCSFGDLHS